MAFICSCRVINTSDIQNAAKRDNFSLSLFKTKDGLRDFYRWCAEESFKRRDISYTAEDIEATLPKCGNCWGSIKDDFKNALGLSKPVLTSIPA